MSEAELTVSVVSAAFAGPSVTVVSAATGPDLSVLSAEATGPALSVLSASQEPGITVLSAVVEGKPGKPGPPGPPGSGGPGGPGGIREFLSGVHDGVNRVFTTSRPFFAGTEWLETNGILNRMDIHYVRTGPNEITLNYAPLHWWAPTIQYTEA